jgi:hypothetical protein
MNDHKAHHMGLSHVFWHITLVKESSFCTTLFQGTKHRLITRPKTKKNPQHGITHLPQQRNLEAMPKQKRPWQLSLGIIRATCELPEPW